jgi:hypothetical protein
VGGSVGGGWEGRYTSLTCEKRRFSPTTPNQTAKLARTIFAEPLDRLIAFVVSSF